MAEESLTIETPNSTTTTQEAPIESDAPPADGDGSILGDVKSDAPAADTDKDNESGSDQEADSSETSEAAPALHGEAPEAYELAAPEGFSLDAEAVKLFEPVFKKLDLTNEGAQELVNAAPAFVQQITDQVEAGLLGRVAENNKAWAAETMADPDIGGAHFEESKAICAKMFDKFGWAEGGGFRTYLNESGLGNHPEMIRAMVKVARATGEDSFERGDSSKGEVPVWDRVYGGPSSASE